MFDDKFMRLVVSCFPAVLLTLNEAREDIVLSGKKGSVEIYNNIIVFAVWPPDNEFVVLSHFVTEILNVKL